MIPFLHKRVCWSSDLIYFYLVLTFHHWRSPTDL